MLQKNIGECKIKKVEGAIILPAREDPTGNKIWCLGGVIDENGLFVEESGYRDLFGGYYEYNDDNIIYCEETVVFFGPFISHWGHFLCDQISRLWFVIDEPQKYKIVYCGWNWGNDQSDLWGNFLELFELLDISASQLCNIKRPVRFKEVIIPQLSMLTGPDGYFHENYKKIINRLVKNVDRKGYEVPEKVYFTRTDFGEAKRKEYGEPEIEEIFRANGFEIICPEKYSLRDQILVFQHAKQIAAISGSITHGAIFGGENTLIIILNKIHLPNDYQIMVNRIAVSYIVSVDIYRRILPVCFGLGPFLYSPGRAFRRFALKYGIFVPAKRRGSMLKGYKWYFNKYLAIYKKEENRKSLVRQIKKFRRL